MHAILSEGIGSFVNDSPSYASHGTLYGPMWTTGGRINGRLSFDRSIDRVWTAERLSAVYGLDLRVEQVDGQRIGRFTRWRKARAAAGDLRALLARGGGLRRDPAR